MQNYIEQGKSYLHAGIEYLPDVASEEFAIVRKEKGALDKVNEMEAVQQQTKIRKENYGR